MKEAIDRHGAPGTAGRVLHDALQYDFIVWLFTLGRERRLRNAMLSIAALVPGEMVLDIGCGTGTLAIAARRHVGQRGSVCGIDASEEMIARAQAKARKAGVEATFQNGLAESLPFADDRFDVVLSTLMLHHLPRNPRLQSLREAARVLKPGGRILAVDFESAQRGFHGVLTHFIGRQGGGHGHVKAHDVKADDLHAAIAAAGLVVTKSGGVGMGNLHYTVATKVAP